MRCRFCGVGTYQRFGGVQSDGFADSANRRHLVLQRVRASGIVLLEAGPTTPGVGTELT
jgi:hypothetical protein